MSFVLKTNARNGYKISITAQFDVLRNGLLFFYCGPFIRNHFGASFKEPEYASLRLGIGPFQLRRQF
jgi:hypothetical protein